MNNRSNKFRNFGYLIYSKWKKKKQLGAEIDLGDTKQIFFAFLEDPFIIQSCSSWLILIFPYFFFWKDKDILCFILVKRLVSRKQGPCQWSFFSVDLKSTILANADFIDLFIIR